jgi:alpha-galactosidase
MRQFDNCFVCHSRNLVIELNLEFKLGMKYFLLSIVFVLTQSCITGTSKSKDNSDTKSVSFGKAQTPPMGWNSWNCLDYRATEADIKIIADYMADNLLQYGWEYVVVDAGWYYPPEITCNDGKMMNIPQNIDEYGRLHPDVTKYPGSANGAGFKPLADYIHSKGLKFGIHIMRGIPWNAVAEDLPVLHSDLTAKSIADEQNVCEWNKSMLGIKDKEGAKAYYFSLIKLYNDWGVDFIKADDMIRPLYEHELLGLSEAISKINPDIVLSLSPGKASLDDAIKLGKNSQTWRVSNDFWDNWNYVVPMFDLLNQWTPYRKEGNWPDADMLPFGKLRKNGGDEWVASLLNDKPENIVNEYSRLTSDEMYTVMTLWSIAKSPLILGGYLPENDELTNLLITNKKAIAVNQNSVNNKEILNNDGIIVWKASDKDSNSKSYLAVFNLTEDKKSIDLNFKDLDYSEKLFKVDDIWENSNASVNIYSFKTEISSHGVRFFELTAD